MEVNKRTITIVCPLYDAEQYILNFHKRLEQQRQVNIVEYKYILTESNDNTENILIKNNIPYEKIKKAGFSHSLTREKAAMSAKGTIVVFLTQDVEIKDDQFLSTLIAPILKGEASATYARQITKYDNLEKYTRDFNYPKVSKTITKADVSRLGLRAFFFSDAASAIKKDTFKKVGGYDHKLLPISEDMYIAYKLITSGHTIKYEADAEVYHSHRFSLKQLYDRYRLTGIFMQSNPQISSYGTTASGSNMATYILKKLLHEKRLKLLARYPFDMAARLIGLRVGMLEAKNEKH